MQQDRKFSIKRVSAIVLIVVVLFFVTVSILNKTHLGKNELTGETLQDKEDEGALVKDTYTYTNHGFSIELPKGYIPMEYPLPDRPVIGIALSDGMMDYYTDASFFGNKNSSGAGTKYIKDVKIGENTFKLYERFDPYGIVATEYSFWFQQGKIGYHYHSKNNQTGDYGAKDLETFKFVGWPQVEGNKEDLVSFSIKPGQEVSGEMTVTGILKGAYFFEGSFPITILDSNKISIPFGGHATATTDWMTAGPVSFTTYFDFSKMPKGNHYIALTQDDPRDESERGNYKIKQVLIPIVVK